MPNSFDQGAPISASHFMENLVTLYDDYWRDPKDSNNNVVVFSFDQNHTTDLSRRKGWGQPQVEVKGIPQQFEVLQGMLVEREHLNTVIAHINAGLYHIDNNITLIDARPLIGNTNRIITHQEFEQVRNIVITTVEQRKNICTHDVQLSLVQDTVASNNLAWSDDLYIVQKFSFNDYTHARHFFNAGGLLTLQLSSDGSGITGQVWDDIFDNLGYIGFGAETTCSVQGNSNLNIGAGRGFYNIPSDGTYATMYETYGQTQGCGTYAYAYAYTSSAYGGRRIRVEAKAEDTGSTFDVYLKLSLLEDVTDDTFPITANIELDSGYKRPLDSPDLPPIGPTNRTPWTGEPGTSQYGFSEIQAPTTINHHPWTADTLQGQ